MDEPEVDLSRREFLKKSGIIAAAAAGAGALFYMGYRLSLHITPFDSNSYLQYLGENLTNLHFYFINASVTTKNRVPTVVCDEAVANSYMIVKLPQQHVSEELLREAEFNNNGKPDKSEYIHSGKKTQGFISGYTYLAFEMFPDGAASGQRKIDVSDIRSLLAWNNRNLFRLITPEVSEYRSFGSFGEMKNLAEVKEPELGNGAFHAEASKKLFNAKAGRPITLIEIPQGLLVTPYTGDAPPTKTTGGTLAIFSEPPIEQEFSYRRAGKSIDRFVQPIWNAQMWFQRFDWTDVKQNGKEVKVLRSSGEKYNPKLRAAGYLADPSAGPARPPTAGCVDDPGHRLLPTYLDKQELTFLTSLGRTAGVGNAGPEWDIKTRGLTFTGLGAVSKFHYKNLKPPQDMSLAEYEHHLVLGRDEYIKVARLGVISVTGQRALHVKIGQRKIRHGVSYMEFKEYVEIVEHEKKYYDSDIFKRSNPVPEEPENFIHAWRDYSQPKAPVQHTEDPNVWHDDTIWSVTRKVDNPATSTVETEPALPDKWTTHYRRWPFQKVTSHTLVTAPINTDKRDVPVNTIVEGCAPCGSGPGAFWPVLETDVRINSELEFDAVDWEGKDVSFKSTFMFIRKEIIDGASGNDACSKAVYENFFNASAERRHVSFGETWITLTRDFESTGPTVEKGEKELPNKSNRSKTDFVEYYFSLCREPDSADIFNRRVFPLYPQMKRAQLYVDGLQSYTPEPLSSIVEYNNDYVNYGFRGTKVVSNQAATEPDRSELFNKARLIYNHTDKFLKGRETILSQNASGIWEEPTVKDGYEKIRKAFSGAGEAVGALVNPDFDVESIGLVKQSIAVAKDINRKYQDLNAITNFNPSDLFRQTPELLNGISLLEVLQDEFPALEGPVNQIKNVVGQIELIAEKIKSSGIVKELEDAAATANKVATDYLNAVKTIQAEIDQKKAELQQLKDQLNVDHQFSELKSLVESKLEELKTGYLKLEGDIVTIVSQNISELTDELTVELLTCVETLVPFHKVLRDWQARLDEVLTKGDSQGRKFSAAVEKVLKDYQSQYLKGKALILLDLDAQQLVLPLVSEVKAAVAKQVAPYFDQYKNLAAKGASFDLAAKEYLADPTSAKSAALAAATKELNAHQAIISQSVKQLEVFDLSSVIAKVSTTQDRVILEQFGNEFSELQATVKKAFDIVRTNNLPFLVDRLKKASEDIKILKKRLSFDPMSKIQEAISNAIRPTVTKARANLRAKYLDPVKGYDTYRGDFEKLVLEVGPHLDAYRFSLERLVWEGIDGKEYERIRDTLGITKDELAAISINSLTAIQGLGVPDLDAARKKIEKDFVEFIRERERTLLAEVKKYETFVRDQVESEVNGIVFKVKTKLDQYKQELLNTPVGQAADDLYQKVVALQEIYNLLTSLSRKEINYSWNTKSLKSADFGIVSFVASTSPATELTVNVVNVIHFRAGQFPPVVDRLESRAENRLTNFGIGLLKAIYVNFNEVSFVAETNKAPKFDCKIRDVEFAGAFAFVQALQSCFKDLLGDNFTLDINPSGVSISYLLPIPFIGAPSFGFRDILFQIIYRLYFDGRPMELGVGIGTLENKTKLSVGIYTGFFFFNVLGNPKQGITTIEVALEFGGYFGLNLGPLRGEVKLVVGLYYRKDSLGVEIQGYFLCEGSVKLWCFMISARFYMGVISRGGSVSGRCTVTYSVKLGFFKKSFSATYSKQFAGASPNGGGSGTKIAGGSIHSLSRSFPSGPALAPPSENTKRHVRPLDRKEWDTFVDSYID